MTPAVIFNNVYKEYPFYQHITAGFKSFLFHLPKSIASLKKTRFIALNKVSFEVKKGEVFGIIGRNGSGKSTILGLTAGVMKPDRGSVMTRGKISSLLELGAGFHPELSGIENIILNGILSGNTREEMMEKMQDIIDFSELGDFVYQPLRTYSSGMHARLGFSVAVHIDPEILLVDEALAVGDLEFKEKCNRKMKEFMESGATVIIVSHDMPAIAELCNRVAWIDGGTIMKIGSPKDVIRDYLNFLGIPFDMDEEEPPGESEKESVIDDQEIKQDSSHVPESLRETAHIKDTAEIPAQKVSEQTGPVPPPSWWDSPVVMDQIETIITGDPEMSFYNYLKSEYSIAHLRRGLCIGGKIRGLEDNFIKYGTCRSFDSVHDADELERLPQLIRGFNAGQYDLLLCVDLLSHIGNLESFLEDVKEILQDEGLIIALEYTGPAHVRWTEKETNVADMILKGFNNQDDWMSFPEALLEKTTILSPDEIHEKTAASSDIVIPLLGKLFDVVAVRYFGGPLYDLILNRVLNRLDQTHEKDVVLLKTIMQCERVLIQNGILESCYAMIIAKKRSSHDG
jgi:lipopolysaccharide transport system ATP-binding protein